jgi:hypothetical protein
MPRESEAEREPSKMRKDACRGRREATGISKPMLALVASIEVGEDLFRWWTLEAGLSGSTTPRTTTERSTNRLESGLAQRCSCQPSCGQVLHAADARTQTSSQGNLEAEKVSNPVLGLNPENRIVHLEKDAEANEEVNEDE